MTQTNSETPSHTPGEISSSTWVISSIEHAINDNQLTPQEAENILSSLKQEIQAEQKETERQKQELLDSLLQTWITLSFSIDHRSKPYLWFTAEDVRKDLANQGIQLTDPYHIRKSGDIFYFHDQNGTPLAQYNWKQASAVSWIDFVWRDTLEDNVLWNQIDEIISQKETQRIIEEIGIKQATYEQIRKTFQERWHIQIDTIDLSNPEVLETLELLTGFSPRVLKQADATISEESRKDGTHPETHTHGRILQVESNGTISIYSTAREKIYKVYLNSPDKLVKQ